MSTYKQELESLLSTDIAPFRSSDELKGFLKSARGGSTFQKRGRSELKKYKEIVGSIHKLMAKYNIADEPLLSKSIPRGMKNATAGLMKKKQYAAPVIINSSPTRSPEDKYELSKYQNNQDKINAVLQRTIQKNTIRMNFELEEAEEEEGKKKEGLLPSPIQQILSLPSVIDTSSFLLQQEGVKAVRSIEDFMKLCFPKDLESRYRYSTLFKEQRIEMDIVKELDKDALEQIGVNTFGDRFRILKVVESIRKNEVVTLC